MNVEATTVLRKLNRNKCVCSDFSPQVATYTRNRLPKELVSAPTADRLWSTWIEPDQPCPALRSKPNSQLFNFPIYTSPPPTIIKVSSYEPLFTALLEGSANWFLCLLRAYSCLHLFQRLESLSIPKVIPTVFFEFDQLTTWHKRIPQQPKHGGILLPGQA